MEQTVRSVLREKLKRINKEDLKYVEKDLRYYEKVSMTLLLFGNQEKHKILYALQKLMTMYNSQSDETQMLYEYASMSHENEWKVPLIEALAIIKANRVTRKLGFSKAEIYETFLPHITEISVSIHPVLKLLYKICEDLTPAEAGKLLQAIRHNSTIRFYDESYLELIFLDWISKDIISIGNVIGKVAPDLDHLVEYFKMDGKISLYDSTLSVISKFNENLRQRRNFNDCALGMSSNYSVARSESFGQNDSVSVREVDLSYRIDYATAGFILIINQMDFTREEDPELQHLLPKEHLNKRDGSQIDEKSLETTFTVFGYKAVIKRNLKHHEILSKVEDFAARSIGFDSLIVAILSHGSEGAIYGSNSIPVEIANIERLMATDSLLNKSKMLIIQACQGSELQRARIVLSEEETDGPGDRTAALLADMLKITSTVPGYASIRHVKKGTWFIQAFCKYIQKYGDSKHIVDILTIVFQDVQERRGSGNECMVPIMASTLKKYFYLPKNVSM